MADIIDTHSHIYLDAFDADRSEVIQRAIFQGVTNILLPNVDRDSIASMYKLVDEYAECLPMIGLHPTSVKENYLEELAHHKTFCHHAKNCAIGEIGLDYYWDTTFIKEQKEAFEEQIKWAIELDLPIVIHCRNAFDDTLAIVDKYAGSQLKGVFHSFSGGISELEHILAYPNFYIGINGTVTFKNSQLPELLNKVNLSRVLIETDAPYLSPMPYRGKRNEPAYLSYVIDKLADIYKLDSEAISQATSDNARLLFNLKQS